MDMPCAVRFSQCQICAVSPLERVQGEHEASRRMKTELLVQMDGLARTDDLVFVLAATNLPWELDQAMLRRLEKRILVDLPCYSARLQMLTSLISDRIGSQEDLEIVARGTAGYSGSDVMLVAKEAGMRPLRRLMAVLEGPCCASRSTARTDAVGPVSQEDLLAAMQAVKSSTQQFHAQYAAFTQQFGSQLSSEAEQSTSASDPALSEP